MNTKNLIVLALVAVVVLTGALVVTVAGTRGGDDMGENKMVAREQSVPAPRPSDGTPTGESARTSVEVVDENVKTQVVVE